MTIGNRVIYLLKQKKLKQKDLAEYLETKPSTVNGWNQKTETLLLILLYLYANF